ncbi:MAG: peptidoglycan-associated lipoprotein Pal [Desulfobacterales bacterium]
MKRKIGLLLTLVLLVPGLMLTTSCSKKVVKDDAGAYERTDLTSSQPGTQAPVEQGRITGDDAAARALSQEELSARERFMNEDIYFAFDQSVLTAEAQRILQDKAQWMQSRPDVSVIIEGHCDERGTTEYNLALGDRRAESAKAFLVNLGIAASRMTTVSYGEERPADPGHNEAAWARNRRAHFVIQ